jgi:hypothetical protein
MGDKTQKDKQKKTLQHEAKKAAEHQKREATIAQHPPYPDTQPSLSTQHLPAPSK